MGVLSISSPTPNWTPMWRSCTTISEFEKARRHRRNLRRSEMKRLVSLAALAVALVAGTAQAQQVTVKSGVLSDNSSLYSDLGGPGAGGAAERAGGGLIQ